MTEIIDYRFSKETFPRNRKIQQHAGAINDDDAHFEYTILAGKILGVKCCDTVMSGDQRLDVAGTYYQITPDPYSAKTEIERKEYEAFNEYFYENYGMHEDRCYFNTEQDAFCNIIKAWHIWKYILSEDERKKWKNGF